MGLDMYMTAEVYASNVFAKSETDKKFVALHQETSERIIDLLGCKFNLNRTITLDVMYWRKANAIHKWFVDNVQDGEDNCARYYVEMSQLDDLLSLCERIMNNKPLAPELLPCVDGFFFGGNQYNDYYFECIQETIDVIKEIKKLPVSVNLYYNSSW